MKNNKGVALVMTMYIMVIVAMIMVAFCELTISDIQITSNNFNRIKARYIADSGIEYAVYFLRQNSSWTASAQGLEYPSGSGNTYVVTYPDASGKILSIGRLATGEEVRLQAGVSVGGSSAPYKVRITDYTEV